MVRYEGPIQELREWRSRTRVTVGYPPFQKTYSGREALEYASPAKRREIEKALEQVERLAPQVTRHESVDEEAARFNATITIMNRAIREYRGDLIYALIQTGDDQMFQRAIDEIDRQVDNQQWAAIDLMRYLYLAVFDGYMLLYDESSYERASNQLQRVAEGADRYQVFRFGESGPPRHYDPARRNFGEYAFHLVHLLREPQVLQWFHKRVQQQPQPQAPQRDEDFKFTPYNFTMADIRAARERAIQALYNPQQVEGVSPRRVLPSYALAESRMEQLRDTHDAVRRQELIHEFGNQALIAWAMLAGGESFQDPRLFRRINWVLSSDTPYTFDRGMRLQMLAQMPYERWRPWINRDERWITNALSRQGNWEASYFGGDRPAGWGDHANGAYGVLGLWAAEETGADIPMRHWEAVDKHWRATQEDTPGGEPAGWAVGMLNVNQSDEDTPSGVGHEFYSQVNGPMTAAGVATLTLTERYIYGSQRTNPDEQNVSRHLRKGIRWLDENFRLQSNDPAANWYYYMWTMQRVGQATGYRTFNDVDWFRDVTAEMLNRQQENGLWEDPTGQQGTLVSTGFALLYLSNSYAPIAVSKVRFDGEWNNRPHDIWNFVDYASELYEVDTSWQIVELDQPVYQLIESPILYMSTNTGFELSEEQIGQLRAYIDAGGLLVLNPDKGDANMGRSYRELIETLYPDRELKEIPDDHPIYSLHQDLSRGVRMRMIDNGIRPMVIWLSRDIGESLQTNEIGRTGSFVALSNLYLYTVSLDPRRTRLERDYIHPDQNADQPREVQIARLRHNGAFNPEPAALPQLKALMARDHETNLQLETIDPAALSNQRMAFLTTLGDAELSPQQATAIRQWLSNGGTLWLDAAGGSDAAAANASKVLRQIVPDARPIPLSSTSPIISGEGLATGFDNRRVEYRYFALREMGAVLSPRIQRVEVGNGRIIYSPEDVTTALAGLEHWGIFGYTVPSGRHLVINSILHASQ